MQKVDLPLYVFFSQVGSESIALSISFSIYIRYIFLYPESKYGSNTAFSFGDVSRNSSTVYIFGSILALFCVSFGLFYESLWPFTCAWPSCTYPFFLLLVLLRLI